MGELDRILRQHSHCQRVHLHLVRRVCSLLVLVLMLVLMLLLLPLLRRVDALRRSLHMEEKTALTLPVESLAMMTVFEM